MSTLLKEANRYAEKVKMQIEKRIDDAMII